MNKGKNSLWILVLILCSFLAVDTVCANQSINRVKADKLFQRAMYDEAIVAYKRLLERAPDNFSLRLQYARALKGNELYKRAIAEYEYLIQAAPENSQVIREFGQLWEELEEYNKAIAFYEKALKNVNNDISLRLSLANAYFDDNKLDQAISEYEKIIKEDSGNFDSLIGLGKSYYYKRKHDEAKEYFIKAQTLNANDMRTYLWLGEICLVKGNYVDAVEQLEQAQELDDKNMRIKYFLAEAYLAQEQQKKAIKIFQDMLKIEPESDEVRIKLAGMYLNQSKYLEAIEVLRSVSEQEPFSYQKGILLAFAYGALGEFDNFWKVIKQLRIVVVILLMLCIFISILGAGGIGFLFLCAFWLGREMKNRNVLFKNVPWTLFGPFFVCVLLFFLPIVLGTILGALVYGNWFLIFTGSYAISNQSTQLAIITQVLTVLFVCGLILWFVIKKNRQSLKNLGFKTINLSRLLRMCIGSIISIFVFSALYLFLFMKATGHTPKTQFISKVISTSVDVTQMLPLFLFVVIFGPLAEEIIFRGFIFSSLRRYSNFVISACICSILFGVFHFQLSLFIPIVFMGFVFCFLFERTRSILPSVFTHLIWNCISFSSIFFIK